MGLYRTSASFGVPVNSQSLDYLQTMSTESCYVISAFSRPGIINPNMWSLFVPNSESLQIEL